MQNSKINTVLLVILIILVAVGLWFMMGKNNVEINTKEDTSAVSSENSQNINSTQPSQNTSAPTPTTEKQYSSLNLRFSYASNASVKTIPDGKVEVSVGANDPYAETVGFYSVELPLDFSNYTKLPSEKHGDTTFEVYQATESGTRVYLVRNGRQAIVVTIPFRAGGNETTKYVDLASISL